MAGVVPAGRGRVRPTGEPVRDGNCSSRGRRRYRRSAVRLAPAVPELDPGTGPRVHHVYPVFIPLFLTGDYQPFCSAGMGTATLGFILIAPRLWRQYDDVLATGRSEESDTKRSVIMYGVVSTVFLLICFELLVFFVVIPGIDFLVLPAFMVGLTILPWYVILLVGIWEARTGCRLYFDRNGRNASMFVLRGP